jgi:CubicO group peptidase (beta-lactamase class C family)
MDNAAPLSSIHQFSHPLSSSILQLQGVATTTGMDSVERELREQTGKNNLPGVMLAATNRDGRSIALPFMRTTTLSQYISRSTSRTKKADHSSGSLNYTQYFGNASLQPDARPVSGSTTFCLASSTKLATSVAVMQCVERRLVGLEDDVSIILPELEDAQIFTGVENGKPVLKKVQNTITLR